MSIKKIYEKKDCLFFSDFEFAVIYHGLISTNRIKKILGKAEDGWACKKRKSMFVWAGGRGGGRERDG